MERRRKTGDYITLPIQALGRIFSRGKPQIIESAYERENSGRTALEYIELDLSGLEAGHSRLTVTVEDLIANDMVSNSFEFDLEN